MDTRQHILIAAHELFYRQGFHACGVELLAQQAGTTKRTLYAHFGSKDGLIEAVLAYRHEQFIARMQAALQQRPADEADRAYLDFITAWTQSKGFCGCMFINASAEYADARAAPHRQAARHKAQVRQLLRARLQEGGRANAEAAADLLFLYGEGLIVSAQTGPSTDARALQARIPAMLQSIRQLSAA